MDVGNRDGKPVIALAMGDPAGISPELTAKVVALDEVRDAARLMVVGDRRVFDEGARIAGVKTDIKTVVPESPASEFNILDRLWNARVTSHISLAEVPARLTKKSISRALRLTDACMRSAGFARP